MQDGFKYFVYCHLSVSVKESFQDICPNFFNGAPSPIEKNNLFVTQWGKEWNWNR